MVDICAVLPTRQDVRIHVVPFLGKILFKKKV